MIKKAAVLLIIVACNSSLQAQSVKDLFGKAYSSRVEWKYDSTFYYMGLVEKATPKNIVYKLIDAQFLADFSKYKEAIVKFSELRKNWDELPEKLRNEAIITNAICYLCSDSTEKGFEIMKDGLEQNKNSVVLTNFIAHLYFCAGRMEEARNYFRQSVEIDSSDSWAVYFIGETSFHLGDSVEANRFFNKTLQMERESKSFMMTPFVYCFTHKPDQAIKMMKEIVGSSDQQILNLAAIYGITGRKSECIMTLKKYMGSRSSNDYFYIMHCGDYLSVKEEQGYNEIVNILIEK